MLLISLDSLGIRLSKVSSWDVAFWFGIFTAAAMSVVIRIRTGAGPIAVVRTNPMPVLGSGVLQAASTTFFILAINSTTVSNTVVIVAAAPIVAAAVARVVLGETITARTGLAIVVSIAGILMIVGGSLDAGRLEGDLYAVAAIVAFAANLTIWRAQPGQDWAIAIALGGVIMAVVAVVPADPASVTGRALVILAVLGGITGPSGRVAVASSTRYLPAAQVSLFTPVETVAASGWAWIFLSEAPPAATIAGGVIVIAAVVYGTVQHGAS